jgi:hypothetical protein
MQQGFARDFHKYNQCPFTRLNRVGQEDPRKLRIGATAQSSVPDELHQLCGTGL